MSHYYLKRSWMCKFWFFTFFSLLLPQIPMDTVYSKCVSLLLLLLVNVGCGISEMFVLSGVADIQRFIVNYCKKKRLSVLYVWYFFIGWSRIFFIFCSVYEVLIILFGINIICCSLQINPIKLENKDKALCIKYLTCSRRV